MTWSPLRGPVKLLISEEKVLYAQVQCQNKD